MDWNYFLWRSLKTRVTLLTLAIFLIGIWSLAFYASKLLREDMEHLLSEQQVSTAAIIAEELNNDFVDRLAALEKVASTADAAMRAGPAAVQARIEQRPVLQTLFSGGVTVVSADGTVIADFPISTGRLGLNYMDRDFVSNPLKLGKSTIGRPVMGKILNQPIIGIGVPIRDAQGKVSGAIVGVVNLGVSGFLDHITKNHYGKTGGYLLVAPQYRLVVTATDKRRNMEILPAPGVNWLIDRFVQGLEGSGVVVNPVGIEVMSSAKNIPVPGWYLAVTLPTEEAFAPIKSLQQRIFLATAVFTLLAGVVIWWMVRRQLAPMNAAVKSLALQSTLNVPLQPLRIVKQDEVGRLLGSFNRLLATLGLREDALRASDARFRSLAEMSSDFYWETDVEHRLTLRTESKREIAEAVFQIDSAIGKRRWEIDYETPDESGWQQHRQTLDAHVAFRDFEISRRRVNGLVHHLSISGYPLFDAVGNFTGYRGVGVDITARKQSEEVLDFLARSGGQQTGEPFFNALARFLAGSLGMDFVCIDVLETPGLTARTLAVWHDGKFEDNITYALKDTPCGDVVARSICCFTEGVQQRFPRDQALADLRAESYVGVTITGHAGTPIGLIAVISRRPLLNQAQADATLKLVAIRAAGELERLTAERLMHESNARYRTLIEWSPEPLGVHRGGKIVYVNPATLRMLGAAPGEDLVGKPILELVHPDFHQIVLTRTAQMMSGGGSLPVMAEKFLKLDGSVIDVEVQSIGIVYDGEPAVQVAIRDITARKRAEDAHALLETQLRQSQKMEAIGTLAGGIAHDFNNILATILGNVDLACEDVSANPLALESLDEIRKASSRARDLVQQILSFSRRQPTTRKPILLAPIVEESARLLRGAMPARLKLDVYCAADVPPVLADGTQIEQVLINLATNAMQAMGSGSGHIGICLDTVMLDAAWESAHPGPHPLRALHDDRAGSTVRLSVRDDGPGMDAVTLSRIFEPFFTTKSVDEGTGLGLSVVHGIVQTHEGTIVVESQLGEGSTFTIYLPVATEPIPELVAAIPVQSQRSPTDQHILYIDDDEALVFLLQRLLERRGYRVSGYTDQREALDALRADPTAFDLVVTDYNMPGMSGLEVAQEVRTIRADLTVAIASGFIDEALHAEAAGVGVRELIFKANAVEDLCDAFVRLAQTVAVSSKPNLR